MILHTLRGRERAASPAIAVVLTAAIAIVLTVTIGAVVLSAGNQNVKEPAPTVSAEIERASGDADGDNEKISVLHKGGDTVAVSDLKIITTADCLDRSTFSLNSKRGTLSGFPLGGLDGVEPGNVTGDNIFETLGSATQAPLSGSTNTDWTAGERLVFEIDDKKCGVREDTPVRVTVVHEPSNTIISESLSGIKNFQVSSPADASYDYSFPNARSGNVNPGGDDILTVGITSGGEFPPEAVYLDVTVDDGTNTASANGSFDEWTGADASFGATYKEVPDDPGEGTVGAGDRLGNDLTSANSGPGGFGPLDEASETTDISIKVRFQGKTISQKTLTVNGFEVS